MALFQEPMSSSSSQRMTSARMNPRCRSEWITPAHSGPWRRRGTSRPGSPCRPSRNVRSPSRWCRAHEAGQRPFAEAEAFEKLCPLGGIETRASASSCTHSPSNSGAAGQLFGDALDDRVGVVEVVFTQVDHRDDRLGRQQEVRLQERAVLVGEPGAVQRRGALQVLDGALEGAELRRRATCRPWPPCVASRAATPRSRRRPARVRARAS